MIKPRYLLIMFFALVFLMASVNGSNLIAQDSQKNDTKTTRTQNKTADIPKNAEDQAERAKEAAEVLTSIMGIPEGGIPEELMSRATGIAVIPHVVKGAFGIGGRYGKGLMSQRLDSGKWSTPTFVEIGGGSFGLQLGVEATDLVLVFTNREGVDSLMKGKVKLGADAAVAAGPVGRKAEIGTDVRLNSAIYSYSRSKGLFAGVSLDGAAVTVDDSANAKVYGKDAKAEQLLKGTQSNTVVAPFMAALEKHAPATAKTRPSQ